MALGRQAHEAPGLRLGEVWRCRQGGLEEGPRVLLPGPLQRVPNEAERGSALRGRALLGRGPRQSLRPQRPEGFPLRKGGKRRRGPSSSLLPEAEAGRAQGEQGGLPAPRPARPTPLGPRGGGQQASRVA